MEAAAGQSVVRPSAKFKTTVSRSGFFVAAAAASGGAR
jgi:hypothetical protein